VADKKKSTRRKPAQQSPTHKTISQKQLADRLGFSPATVSLVLNRSGAADSIPQETKDLIFDAARKLEFEKFEKSENQATGETNHSTTAFQTKRI